MQKVTAAGDKFQKLTGCFWKAVVRFIRKERENLTGYAFCFPVCTKSERPLRMHETSKAERRAGQPAGLKILHVTRNVEKRKEETK